MEKGEREGKATFWPEQRRIKVRIEAYLRVLQFGRTQEPPLHQILDSHRRGSMINTDRFPKRALKAQAFSGVQGLAPPRNYLDFYSLKSPFLGFRVIQMGYWPDFNLESVLIVKNIFNMKSVTDFRKTMETGVDPHLSQKQDGI